MESTASGVLQSVSPWSTSTGPMRFAAAVAALRNDALRPPIAISAMFIAYFSQLDAEWIDFSICARRFSNHASGVEGSRLASWPLSVQAEARTEPSVEAVQARALAGPCGLSAASIAT